METEEIIKMGDDSGFFGRRDVGIIIRGECKKIYKFAPETWIEEYEDGFILYHLGNSHKYRADEEKNVFLVASVLGARERELGKAFG